MSRVEEARVAVTHTVLKHQGRPGFHDKVAVALKAFEQAVRDEERPPLPKCSVCGATRICGTLYEVGRSPELWAPSFTPSHAVFCPNMCDVDQEVFTTEIPGVGHASVVK